MESALRPRDIQARIRAGASPDEVAEAAGVPVEKIAAFADPVIAERDYIAGLARTNPVRRRGETSSHRTLRNAVADALAAKGVDADEAEWDAWKLEDRRWQVKVAFEQDGAPREGLFVFDAMGRFSVAANDQGRALIGDGSTDQLALVKATQDEPEAEDDDARADEPYAEDAVEVSSPEAHTDSSDDDAEDAFHDGDLQEVDGVFDIVPPARGDLDILYDMLSSFDEDSVKIYAGLVHPKESTPLEAAPVAEPDPEPEVEEEDESADEEMTGLVPRMEPVQPTPAPEPEPVPAAEAEPAASADEPEQLALIEGVEDPAPKPKPRTRRKRASVPSWDEIMFGSPRGDAEE